MSAKVARPRNRCLFLRIVVLCLGMRIFRQANMTPQQEIQSSVGTNENHR